VELKAAYDLPALRSAGYKLPAMKDAGFSPLTLKAAEYRAEELKGAGFTALDLRGAGFDLLDLDKAGYFVEDLKNANYTDVEISTTAVFASAEFAMRSVPVCRAALTSLGAGHALDQQEAEDTGEDNIFKRIQIRAATDDLVLALRHPAIAKNLSTAQKLRAPPFGVRAYSLLAAGFKQEILAESFKQFIKNDFWSLICLQTLENADNRIVNSFNIHVNRPLARRHRFNYVPCRDPPDRRCVCCSLEMHKQKRFEGTGIWSGAVARPG
jgi:hypothetical protein